MFSKKLKWKLDSLIIDYEEFLDLVRGENSGFGRRQRQAFRQLLKQTVEFIVPYKYSYQNQYSCSPPPAFMLSISLLQAIVFVYNCVMFYKITGEAGLNGPVPHCSHLIFNPDKRYQVWRYITYMMIHFEPDGDKGAPLRHITLYRDCDITT